MLFWKSMKCCAWKCQHSAIFRIWLRCHELLSAWINSKCIVAIKEHRLMPKMSLLTVIKKKTSRDQLPMGVCSTSDTQSKSLSHQAVSAQQLRQSIISFLEITRASLPTVLCCPSIRLQFTTSLFLLTSSHLAAFCHLDQIWVVMCCHCCPEGCGRPIPACALSL